MPTPIEHLIDQGATLSRFASNSRYANLPLASLQAADGREVVYVTRRFIAPSAMDPRDPTHSVTEGERPDHLAHMYLGDPERFWQLCDHNLTRKPWELTTEVGAIVRLPGGGGSVNTHPFFSL
jgi:hypothetical protein